VDPYTDEQTERLKAWWRNYGNSLIAGVALGATLLAGLTYWRHYTNARNEKASDLYAQLITAQQQGNRSVALDHGKKLIEGYDATPYAGKGALLLARLSFEAKDLAGARKHLEWAAEHATEQATRLTARLRLARLALDQGDAAGALRLLDTKDWLGFKSQEAELRGDILAAQGNKDGARKAYAEALAALPRGSSYGPALQMKLDDLGPDGNPS